MEPQRHLREAWKAVSWYVNQLTGQSRYETYLAHARATHPEVEPMDRRAFWKQYHAWQDSNPHGRCC